MMNEVLIHLWSEPTERKQIKRLSGELNELDCIWSKLLRKKKSSERTRQADGWCVSVCVNTYTTILLLCLPETTYLSPKLTCDDAGEGAAHGHWCVRGGGPAKGCHDWRHPTEWCKGSAVAVVAIVVRLHGWWVPHQGGVRPIVSKMGIDRCCTWVIGSVLWCRSLVLFTSDTTHCQAYRKDISD